MEDNKVSVEEERARINEEIKEYEEALADIIKALDEHDRKQRMRNMTIGIVVGLTIILLVAVLIK